MFDFKMPTELHETTFSEFIKHFKVGKQDLIVTNRPILEKTIADTKLDCHVIYQEEYGLGEPKDTMINKIIAELKGASYDRVIAVGGGTVIDVAKVLTLQNVENVLDILYGRVPAKRVKGLIVVPTTCGTGSEVTNISILEDTTTHVKKGIVSPDMFPDHAVLVPELLKSAPYKVLAFSSIDALIHAVESYLAPKSNVASEALGIAAMNSIIKVYCKIAKEGQQALYTNVGDLLLASTLAGVAFANTGVGAVHALSYQLGGGYHVPHGESNYAFFDAVLRIYDKKNPTGKIVELKKIFSCALGIPEEMDSIKALNDVINKVSPLKQLREYGMKEEEIETWADTAVAQQQRLLGNNYVPLSRDEIRDLYAACY